MKNDEGLKKEKQERIAQKKEEDRRNKNVMALVNFNEGGITLIALVVTIIILLILAGVAINLSVGDNGLFRKAEEAVNTYRKAESMESQELSLLENELEKAKIDWSKVYDSTGYTPENTPIETNEGEYYIPKGFKLADDSAGKISDGIVIEDKNGNQWVWVPCWTPGGKNVAVENRQNEDKDLSEEEYANKKGLIKFDRYAFSEQIKQDEAEEDGSYKIVYNDYYFLEAMPTDQNESVKKYGGFYIGRYEAGDKESTEAKEMRSEEEYYNGGNGDATHTMTIKKNQVPYNYINVHQGKSLSSGLVEANGYNTDEVFTALCSSYAWDTTLVWIGGEYAKKSPQGNYYNTSFNYKDIMGDTKIKSENNSVLIPTGQTTAVKNIYDMGGNLFDLTTEYNSNAVANLTGRGGQSGNGSANCPSGFRYTVGDITWGYYGIRSTLFIK